MKHIHKITAFLLAAVLLIGALPLQLFLFAAGDTQTEDEVLFSSSFESDDKAIRESVSDDGYYSGLQRSKLNGAVDGEFTNLVNLKSIQGSDDYKDAESKEMLFDSSAATKYLTDNRPSATNPVWISFSLKEAAVLGVYTVTSANDADERDPKSWTLYGSDRANGNWVALDTRTNQSFSERGMSKSYTVKNTTAYAYYKLEITANNGANMTQLADLRLGTGNASGDNQVGDSPMATTISGGPSFSWAGTGAFDGDKALEVSSTQKSKNPTYARNVIYSDLNIKVSENTRLSYVHFASAQEYDYEYVAMHMVVDLKFTDGTYLSDLNAVDQNGYGMDPVAKGESDSLYTNQWNYIETKLGEVANGKTIDSICIYFRKDIIVKPKAFLAYFDDLVIENRADAQYEHLSDYITTLRGTNDTTSFSRGLTSPVTTMPNGFNFFTPVTNYGQNTHYDYFDNEIYHFSVSHVPSTWITDYGTWQFMANTSVDTSNVQALSRNQIETANLAASFSHDNEVAKAHYYSVTFDEGSRASGVQVEITPTVHGVYVRFTFPEDADNVNIMFDCVRANGTLTLTKTGSFTATSDHTLNGSTPLQVAGEFDTAPSQVKTDGKVGVAVFPKGTTEVTMKFATSFISKGQAQRNLNLEIPDGETFDSIFEKAQKAWDDVCGRIEVEGATETQLVTLYSNLYRMYAYPNLYSENEGSNEEPKWVYASPYGGRKTEGKLYVNNGFWDSYRTAWAAYALITPTLDSELLNGIVAHYNDNGWIPRWVAPGAAFSMVGTSSDIIFADAYIKGIEFDYEAAFESMLKNASSVSGDWTYGRAENDTAVFKGYVSTENGNGFSWTMEDFISDYCIGVMAEALGYTDEAQYYINHSRLYVNMFNPTAKFFMGKKPDGSWSSGDDYDPYRWWGDYAETNGWTMAFVPVYDGNGLANLYGGQKQLLKKLNDYFDDSYSASIKIEGGNIHEMTEAREVRMGLYSHSNQPAHAIPYLYVYAGAPERTQELVREALSRLYVGAEIGQGYVGDEDNGEMSAWYVLSAMGLYPQNMGSGQYVIGSPLFEKMTVHMDNGKDLVIVANNNSFENVYVQSLTVNGHEYNSAFINHADIANGAELVFTMGSEPSDWGTDGQPISLTTGEDVADPAEDLVTDRFTVKTGSADTAFFPNTVYVSGAASAENLFDNDSDTVATLSDGATITVAPANASRLLLYTVTCSRRNSAPTGLKMEASTDGEAWVTLDEREDLTYQWNQFTRAFAIPDEAFANYKYYRLTLTGGDNMQVAEVEFLALSSDGELGSASAKPALPEKAGVTYLSTPNTNNSGNQGPVDPNTPNTGDPTGSNQSSDTPVGLIIGIVAAVVVVVGGGLVLFFVFKKKS